MLRLVRKLSAVAGRRTLPAARRERASDTSGVTFQNNGLGRARTFFAVAQCFPRSSGRLNMLAEVAVAGDCHTSAATKLRELPWQGTANMRRSSY